MTRDVESMSEEELVGAGAPVEEPGFGALVTSRGALPLAAMNIRGAIAGLSARIEVEQVFENALGEAIEATYVFPLPDRAAVTALRVELGERIVDGEIQERGKARRAYDEAIREGRRAAIAEEDRPGVFTMRVGNVQAGERAVVHLSLAGPVALADGEACFRFPLVVAPRYIPGRALAGEPVGDGTAPDTDLVPDASRITPPVFLPGFPNPVKLGIRLDIDPLGLPMDGLRSSLPASREEHAGGARVEVKPGQRLDRDFVVRYRLGGEEARPALSLAADPGGEEGTFALTVVPPVGAVDAVPPRDVVVVLDRSGSMRGWKMVAARRAAARMIDTLTDRDRFAVLAFDNAIETPDGLPGDALSEGTDRQRFRAVEFLAGLDGRGGTEMAAPLERAAELLAGGYRDRQRTIVLVTDGQVGNEDHILRALSGRLGGTRVFALGIDRAVNAAFLRRLAALGGGACELVESEDRLDDVMTAVHRRIGSPVISELAIRGEGLDIDAESIVPARLPDLFPGAPFVVRGRYRGRPRGGVAVSGATQDGERWEARVEGAPARDGEGGSVDRAIWARARVRDLEDRYAAGGDGALADRIVATSLRFGVLSRFTAFVAVDRDRRAEGSGDPHRVIQPVELPGGWEIEESVEAFAGPPPAHMSMDASAAPPSPGGKPAARRTSAVASIAPMSMPRMGRAKPPRRQVPLDLSAYRERLEAIAEELAGDAPKTSRLARDLRELAGDLASVGAPDALVDAVQKAATGLANGEADAISDTSRVIAGILEGDIFSPDQPTRTRRRFWK